MGCNRSTCVDAVHHLSPGSQVRADDFVYTVDLSADRELCAYAGTSRNLVVVDGRSGAPLFRLHMALTVWSVQLAMLPDGPKLFVGGELPSIIVFDVASKLPELELPVTSTVYCVCITRDALAYSNGPSAATFGAGGSRHVYFTRRYSIMSRSSAKHPFSANVWWHPVLT